MDVDRFKQVNDEFSHLTGDEVLRRIGMLVETAMRSGDEGIRVTDEEFCLLPGIGATCARHLRRMRVAMRITWEAVAPRQRFTPSFWAWHRRRRATA